MNGPRNELSLDVIRTYDRLPLVFCRKQLSQKDLCDFSGPDEILESEAAKRRKSYKHQSLSLTLVLMGLTLGALAC